MTKRFQYDRMSAQELQDWLNNCDMAPNTFCRLTGATVDDMARWLDPERPEMTPPHWVTLMLDLFNSHPANIAQARSTAAEMIKLDKSHSDLGEYPFQKGEYDD